MKRLFNVIGLLFALSVCYSQNIQNLDAKNGFNKFKFESSIELYKTWLINEYGSEVQYYTYVGGDITEVFGNEVIEIRLGYYKGELYSIHIYFEQGSIDKIGMVRRLEVLFGNANIRGSYVEEFGNTKIYYEWGYVWASEKVYLSLDKPKEDNPKMWLISRTVEKKMLNDDF